MKSGPSGGGGKGGGRDLRAADRNIAALLSDGLYRTDHHLAIEQDRGREGRDPQAVVTAHVRRLEALRRVGMVERVAEGLWKVPDDLTERVRQYDAQRLGGVSVELTSHLQLCAATASLGRSGDSAERLSANRSLRQERERSRFVVASYRVGTGALPFKAGIFENTSAIKSMNTIARVGSSLLAT